MLSSIKVKNRESVYSPPPSSRLSGPTSSKRQNTISRSSAEAKYRVVVNAIAEATWLRELLQEFRRPLSKATIVFCDNVSVVYLTTNPVHHQHTKHIETRSLWFMFVYYMFPRHRSLPTSSLRDCHCLCLLIFVPVSPYGRPTL